MALKHLVSMWYELAIFLGFCLGSLFEVAMINWREAQKRRAMSD